MCRRSPASGRSRKVASAAGGPAVGLEKIAVERLDADIECHALLLEHGDGVAERGGRFGLEP